MKIFQATFLGSSTQPKESFKPHKPAIALIGRSNVGKSSLINSLLNRKNLAKTSATPGKTQLINYFLINTTWHLVDLPGYGWAKVSKKKRLQFQNIAKQYLLYNPMLVNAFLLIDSRHPPQPIDLNFIHLLHTHQIPFSIIFTKIDKTPQKKIQTNLLALQQNILQTSHTFPPFFMTSSTHHKGRLQLLQHIQHCLSSKAT